MAFSMVAMKVSSMVNDLVFEMASSMDVPLNISLIDSKEQVLALELAEELLDLELVQASALESEMASASLSVLESDLELVVLLASDLY